MLVWMMVFNMPDETLEIFSKDTNLIAKIFSDLKDLEDSVL